MNTSDYLYGLSNHSLWHIHVGIAKEMQGASNMKIYNLLVLWAGVSDLLLLAWWVTDVKKCMFSANSTSVPDLNFMLIAIHLPAGTPCCKPTLLSNLMGILWRRPLSASVGVDRSRASASSTPSPAMYLPSSASPTP